MTRQAAPSRSRVHKITPLVLGLALALAAPMGAQRVIRPVGELPGVAPACPATHDGYLYSITDGSSTSDNQTGGGSDTHVLICDSGTLVALPDVAGNVATATALAANGGNCAGVNFAKGVDASGAAEGCADPIGGKTASQLVDNGGGTLASRQCAYATDADSIDSDSSCVIEAGAGANTLVVDSASRVGIKTSSPSEDLEVSGTTLLDGATQVANSASLANLSLYGAINLSNTGDAGTFTRYEATTLGPAFFVQKSDSATIGSHSLIDNADALGAMIFRGSDGTTFEIGAQFYAYACAVTGNNDMPGCFDFYTTPDGSTSPSLTLTMESDGDLVVARGDIYADPDTSVGTNTAAWSGTGAGSKLGILTSTRSKAKPGTIRKLDGALDTLDLVAPKRYDAIDRVVRRPDPDAEPICWQHEPPGNDELSVVETCKPGERDVVIPGALNRIGLFAEDLVGVAEGLVIRDDDTGEPVSIDYTIGIVTLLVGAVQELRSLVDTQAQEIGFLQQRLAAPEAGRR